jgi:dienelactone hydrolase
VIRRTAFHLESQGRPLLAWLQEPAETRAERGVVVCPAIGFEQVHAYRSVRRTCDALAEAGFAALRFDWLGTGDSAGDETDWRVTAWLANVRDAIAWLAQHLGSERIDFIGLRVGATLALKIAEERPVERLVLWAPVVKGKRFVRETRMLSASVEGATEQVEAAGFLFVPEILDELETIDAAKFEPRCGAALIVGEESPGLRDRLRSLGIETGELACPGYADMMTYPHYTKVPSETIAAIVDWLGRPAPSPPGFAGDPGRGEGGQNLSRNPDRLGFAVPPSPPTPLPPQSRGERGANHDFAERPIVMAGEPDLFGIVTDPAGGDCERPTILILNAGAVHRVGPNRLSVDVARRFAEEGFRSVRMDIQGLGDSPAGDPAFDNAVYPDTLFRDIERMMTWLRDHEGTRRIVLFGLCSGAYAAFQAAAQSRNRALVEAMLLNPLTFFWREGMPLDDADIQAIEDDNYYMQAMWNPRKWWKLLTGQSRTGLFGALKIAMRKVLRRRSGLPVLPAGLPEVQSEPGAPSHPKSPDLRGDLARIRAADRHIALWFSPGEPGYTILMLQAKRQVRDAIRRGALSIAHVAGADHTFSNLGPRHVLIDQLVEHLRTRYASRVAAISRQLVS